MFLMDSMEQEMKQGVAHAMELFDQRQLMVDHQTLKQMGFS